MPPFDPLPLRLRTPRLELVTQVPEDAGWLAELFSLHGRGVVTAEQAAERISAMARTVAELGIGARVLRRHGDPQALGYVAIVLGRSSLEEPELAYELLPAARGHGYATEGSRALLEATFATGRQRVRATVRPHNTASLRVLDRLGFVRERVTRDADGEVVWSVLERPG